MIINTKTPLGGATYPFLHCLGKKWFLHSWDVDEENPTQYDAPKSVRWINGNHVTDLYVEGMDTTDFLEQTGLHLHMKKGGFVLSKRLSRLMRPYFMYGFFEKEEITVQYLDQGPYDQKVWDGAGRVRRSVLLRVLEKMPSLSPAKQKEMEYELRHAKRIEFTVMGLGDWSADKAGGQDKGHAIVFEDHELEADFVLPKDTKGEVTLEDGSVFVGFYPVHHADTMRIDIQSLINLWGFFTLDDLMKWLHQEGELFLEGIRSGNVEYAMTRIDQTDVGDDDEALEAITNWHIREYVASGGNPMWFGSIVKGLMNQHLKRLNYSTLNRFRLPIPGARYYVMCDEIGDFEVPRGKVKIDPASSTAWVNSHDWFSYIADVLGGADQDDALWVFPFDDYGQFQFLIWRSPNQLGEYVVLEPTEESEYLNWDTTHGSMLEFMPADQNALPPRIDELNPDYLGLVNPNTAGGLGEWLPEYSIEGMKFTIQRASQNRGALGQYCNALLLSKALYDSLPSQPPAALEDVIDGSVKTGTDLQSVKDWCLRASRLIVETRKPVPVRLQARLSLPNEKGKAPLIPETSQDHWFDRLVAGIEEHINYIQAERDVIMAQTMPPIAVFNVTYQSTDLLTEGARFNQIYTGRLPWAQRRRQQNPMTIEESLEQARQDTSTYLDQMSRGDRQARYELLLAATSHYYSNPDHIGRDESVWQLGIKNPHTGTREKGIAQDTIQALREVGVLEQISRLDNGRIVRYPSARVLPIPGHAIKVVGVWFNYWRYTCKHRGQDVPERMQEVSKADMDWSKEQVVRLVHTQFRNMKLDIRQEGERAIAYTEQDNIFGYIAKDQTQDVSIGQTTLCFALAKKDHVWAIFSD